MHRPPGNGDHRALLIVAAQHWSRSTAAGDLFLQLLPRAPQWLEREMHAVQPRSDLHGTKQYVGLEDIGRAAVHFGAPPGMPGIVEYEETAVGRIDLDVDHGVGIAQDARAAGPLPALPRKRGRVFLISLPRQRGRVLVSLRRNPGRVFLVALRRLWGSVFLISLPRLRGRVGRGCWPWPRRRSFEQHGVAWIDIGPAVADQLVEIGNLVVRHEHDARQRPRVLVDVSVFGACNEVEIAGVKRGIDLVDRDSRYDEAHAAQVGMVER